MRTCAEMLLLPLIIQSIYQQRARGINKYINGGLFHTGLGKIDVDLEKKNDDAFFVLHVC